MCAVARPAAVLALSLLPAATFAQAAIAGVPVKDALSNLLPGVTVETSSPVLSRIDRLQV
jgi:hypothetical protein